MNGRLVQTSCRTAQFAVVEATLREWPEVEAVGSFREKKNNKRDITTVFVTFHDEAAATAAKTKLDAIPGIAEAAATVPAAASAASSSSPAQQAKGTTDGHGTRSRRKKGNASTDKSIAAQLLHFESYEDQKRREGPPRKSRSTVDADKIKEGEAQSRRGRGTGRGGAHRGNGGARGAARGGHSRGMRGRGGSAQQPPSLPPQQGTELPQPWPMQEAYTAPPPPPRFQQPRLPLFEACVAIIDNVPFGTTNKYLMERFSAFGRILDVNRYELMVMICYDNPEAVQQCIQHANGTKIHENVVTVSSGTIRIPGSIALQMGY